jgi:rhodanese-related sulfurtransferase
MMIKRFRSIGMALIAVGLTALLAACGLSDTADSQVSNAEAGSYQTLTIEEFAAVIDEQSDRYTIVNVHIPYEGEVAATDAHIPYNDIAALTNALPDRDAPIILYCRTGRMSEEASHALLELGYAQVWDVPGGMIAWERSGRELLDTRP